ncbi:hypothetical protein GCM10023212_24120 [Luteolibacter yonseiensis]
MFFGNLLLVANLNAQAAEGTELLDKVISYPGSYSQVCDVFTSPTDIPYRAFEISGHREATFSRVKSAAIKENRESLVRAVRARLLAIDLAKPARSLPVDPSPDENENHEISSGADPMTLNPFLLDLIRETHAIEALQELLIIEGKLVKGIASAKDDAKAAPPVVDGWLVAEENEPSTSPVGSDDIGENPPESEKDPTPEEIARLDRKNHLFQARVAQRDVVMTIALLLREKSYAPYLKTTFEAAYAKGLKAQLKDEGVDDFKPGDPLTPDMEKMQMQIDKITGLPFLKFRSVTIPYSRESRDEIRAAAAQWISEHP